MTASTLSIIIVNWNTREMLRNCLSSIYVHSDGLALDVIVIDNASTDGSPELVAADFPQVRLIRNAENRGFAAANNQGFEIAKGEQVLLLNSDTIIHGNVLERSVDWLSAHPKVAAMGCRVLNTDGSVQKTCSRYPSLLNQILLTSGLSRLPWPRFLGRYQMADWNRDVEREVEVISGCYLLVRRAVIDQIGPLDESFFFFGEETDWCKRMREAGWLLVFAPIGEITHHGGGSVKKLNAKRDVMLSEAIIRLHRKHSGYASAIVAFLIILSFNGSRAVFWSIASIRASNSRARERAHHFREVFGQSLNTWPSTSR
ncbi:glycosyltransferase family 2 protein [Roseovarius sp.]|uniref:glycosyltransferase family 2 protein n=1 Tax=Roseovarius sp. TaxID=1486281 RepID=UPI003D1347AC